MKEHVAKTLDEIRGVGPLATSPTWKHARKFLASVGTDPFADHLRWLEDEGEPVACVQVFLHQYAVGRAQVGMCLPEYPFVRPELRGRGYFKRLMAGLFDWMRATGYPLAYDHGRKGLYTGLGFAPCFHHSMALIRVEDAVKVQAPGRAERATPDHVAAHEGFFRQPHPLGRGMQCRDERWRPQPQDVWLCRCGEQIEGFAIEQRPRDPGAVLTITDAWAGHLAAAATLLSTVANEAHTLGMTWLRMNCRRESPLARMAVLAGGQFRWWAAQERDWTVEGEDVDSFYLVDLRLVVHQLLPELCARWQSFRGEAPPALVLAMEGQQVILSLGDDLALLDLPPEGIPCVRLPRKAMARAVMGYAMPSELSLVHEGCAVPDAVRAAVDALFVAREPHLDHEETAFGGSSAWGIVP